MNARLSWDSSLLTTLTSSCRGRYRIKSTRASFIQILIPRGVTRIARFLRAESCRGDDSSAKIKGARTTHEIVVAHSLPQGVKASRWERETANASAAVASRNYEVAVELAVSLEEALTNDGGNFYYFRCRPIRRGRLRPHEPRRRLDVFYIHFVAERPPGRYAPPLTNGRGVLLDELFKVLPRARTCGYTK